jgi:hypothetical protein
VPKDNVPDPWAEPSRYHKGELDNLGELHRALAKHTQFREYLERGRAYLQPLVTAAGERRARARSMRRFVDVEPADLARERARVIVWLLLAFGPIWQEAESALHLPPHYVAGALEVAMHGGWGDWDAPPLPRRAGEPVRPRDAAEHLRITVRMHYAAGELPAPPTLAGDVEEHLADYARWARAHSERMPQPIDPAWRAHPGKRKRGRPRGGTGPKGYLHRVQLYNLWHAHPARYGKRPDLWRGREVRDWADFLAEVNEKFASDYPGGNTPSLPVLRRETERAIDWAAPVAGVPADPVAFVPFVPFVPGPSAP